ncbi:DUF4426 domain-containing protein [Aliidiomarina iranensis]|uniref:DUF4426 domain-containing protein n=1 Tax=Aliidiomarina iranensis TaxID=1434071 RepID=A0A432VUH1_9GAMM|nr:DUF4426 domain-containing protein [Aliidiomarina iranensis]RUO19986.1 DUF4426 domain-containing protein [Aliidiomarina iranensis]
MKNMKSRALAIMCLGAMWLSSPVMAQQAANEELPEQSAVQGGQYASFDNWQVHYSAFPSTMLLPDIATRYNIRRSSARGLINISVLDTDREDNPAQRVALQGYALNSLGQRVNLQFRRFVEEPAIYYISEVNHDDDDRLRFFITITQGDRTEELRFTHTFYR